MGAKLVGMAACMAAIAACIGVPAPRAPRITVLPGSRFECGLVCRDPPTCTTIEQGFCAGEYYRKHIWLTYKSMPALPHELVHHVLASKRLPDDGSHEGWPWDLECDRVPACRLWEDQ